MNTRAFFAMVAAGATLAAVPAYAHLADEIVADPSAPVSVMSAPRESRQFGIPNVSEFGGEPAVTSGITLAPYPHETYRFGVPNVSEFAETVPAARQVRRP